MCCVAEGSYVGKEAWEWRGEGTFGVDLTFFVPSAPHTSSPTRPLFTALS